MQDIINRSCTARLRSNRHHRDDWEASACPLRPESRSPQPRGAGFLCGSTLQHHFHSTLNTAVQSYLKLSQVHPLLIIMIGVLFCTFHKQLHNYQKSKCTLEMPFHLLQVPYIRLLFYPQPPDCQVAASTPLLNGATLPFHPFCRCSFGLSVKELKHQQLRTFLCWTCHCGSF